ncbi:YqjF family protein [Planctellipticum variicoloris]|uniref:YqjF family protein n=1 Tax=Planctellipticum variicoloris TaxID=3064265 RepID=UPI0030138E4D|nr:DUF2071 domain-containing protein [Planctomycetaceae bacterium SH412]
MPAPVFLTAEWRRLLLINYQIDPAVLERWLPRGTELDTFNGKSYVSLVGFRFLETRVRGLAIPGHQDFDEVNLRFYVRRPHPEGARRGVVFIKEIVPRPAIAFVARWVYNENYVSHPMRHAFEPPFSSDHSLESLSYSWEFRGKWQTLAARVTGSPQPLRPGSEAEFIAEHYWGYARQRDGSTLEYSVEHPPWKVWNTSDCSVEIDASAVYGDDFAAALSQMPASAFAADGSAVTVRRGEKVPTA